MIAMTRPQPPADIVGDDLQLYTTLRPAPEIGDWVKATIEGCDV